MGSTIRKLLLPLKSAHLLPKLATSTHTTAGLFRSRSCLGPTQRSSSTTSNTLCFVVSASMLSPTILLSSAPSTPVPTVMICARSICSRIVKSPLPFSCPSLTVPTILPTRSAQSPLSTRPTASVKLPPRTTLRCGLLSVVSCLVLVSGSTATTSSVLSVTSSPRCRQLVVSPSNWVLPSLSCLPPVSVFLCPQRSA